MTRKPKLFIGSANESLAFARALEIELRGSAETEVWDMTFRPGRYTLEELVRKASEVDFAAFILGQEDKTESRGKTTPSPRDNVIYEAGLFGGRLEVPRVFILVDARGCKMPSDWAGLFYLTYDPSSASPRRAVRSAAAKVHQQIDDWRKIASHTIEQQILGHWWEFVVNTKEGCVLSLLTISRSVGDSRWGIEGEAWNGDGVYVSRYRSRAVALDARDRRLFYYWEGVLPFEKRTTTSFGVGEIQFPEASARVLARATGWYSDSYRANLQRTITKSTIYCRARDADVEKLRVGSRAAQKRLINTLIGEWRRECRT
jgi:hypothetical protein